MAEQRSPFCDPLTSLTRGLVEPGLDIFEREGQSVVGLPAATIKFEYGS
jgi:hypothetical protein